MNQPVQPPVMSWACKTASWNLRSLVTRDVGGPTRLLKSRQIRSSNIYKGVSTPAWSQSTKMGTTPSTVAPVSCWLSLGLQPSAW